MEENKSWRKSGSFVEALGHAWHGLQFGWGAERNIKIQVGLTLVALVAGWALGLPARDMALIAIASGLVLALEMVNTAIEEVSNVISDSYHHHLRLVKDMAAGAVLVASVAAILVGLFIFLPAII